MFKPNRQNVLKDLIVIEFCVHCKVLFVYKLVFAVFSH